MEALVEILLEAFLEVFFELLGAAITAFVNYLDTNSKVRTKLKNVLTFIFYGLCILLVTLSLIHKKSFLVIITLSYILVFILLQLLKYINNNIFNKKFLDIIYISIKKIINYAFPILLIVFGSLYLTHKTAKIWLIVMSSLTILVFMCMDGYRLDKHIKKRRLGKYLAKKNEKKGETDEFSY